MSDVETFTIKQDDTLPGIQIQCWDDEAKTQKTDLTLATAVNFHMMERDEADKAVPTLKVEAAADIVGAATDGVVEYLWIDAAEDTDTDGRFFGEFEVEWSATSRTTFPNDGFIYITITRDLDSTSE